MSSQPLIAQSLWNTVPPEAQAALHDAFHALERRIADLEARLNQNSTNSSRPPSTDPIAIKAKRRPPDPPSGRKPGGQPGHKRHTRPLVPAEKLRQAIPLKPSCCTGCGASLQGYDPDPIRHQVAEIPPLLPEVVEYQLHRICCSECGVATRACLPPGIPTGPFGPRLRAILAMLAGTYRLAKRPIQQLVADLLGLDISLGMIAKLEGQAASVLEPVVAEMAAEVKAAPCNHIDETSWHEDHTKVWLWVSLTEHLTVFQIAGQRSAKVARSLVGSDPAKIVISDRYSGYDWIKEHQYCWSHLRRDFQAMIDRRDQGSAIGTELLAASDRLFHHWHQVGDAAMGRVSFLIVAGLIRWRVRRALRLGVSCGAAKTEATCRRLMRGEAHLWTFLCGEGIEPTNNKAEQALRHAVLWRKSSGGTVSPEGSRFVERVLSVAATCRQQGRHVLDYLTGCFEANLMGQPFPSLLPGQPVLNSP